MANSTVGAGDEGDHSGEGPDAAEGSAEKEVNGEQAERVAEHEREPAGKRARAEEVEGGVDEGVGEGWVEIDAGGDGGDAGKDLGLADVVGEELVVLEGMVAGQVDAGEGEEEEEEGGEEGAVAVERGGEAFELGDGFRACGGLCQDGFSLAWRWGESMGFECEYTWGGCVAGWRESVAQRLKPLCV